MFDDLVASTAGARGTQAVDAWARVEAAACARRLAAMVAMLDAAHAADGSVDRDQWCLDNWGAVCAHIGAAQRVTSGVASGLLLVGTALRDHFPKVAAVFATGVIGYHLVRTVVSRSMLLMGPDAHRQLDAALADALQTWEPLSVDKTEQAVDAFIERFDPTAVRRTQTRSRGRSIDVVVDDGSGLASLFGTLFTPDAAALDARLTALADTACSGDPRTLDQRRADSMGALARGADRLACLCGDDECPAASAPPVSGVVIHVIAHQDTVHGHPATDDGAVTAEREAEECAGLDGVPPRAFAKPLRDLKLEDVMLPRPSGRLASIRPGVMMGGQFLPGSVTRRAALTACLSTIVHPGQAPPEPQYQPSRALDEFVRCRDVTCRFPGCRRPATTADVDHTIAWPYGPTQASNLKALCRQHHLLKTFWAGATGWRDRQLPDGTVIWTAPDGRLFTTVPGSRLLFPELSEPTAPVTGVDVPDRPSSATGLAMPRRRATRAQDRTRRIAYERELNRAAPASRPTTRDPAPPF